MKLYKGDCLDVMDKLIAEGVKVDAIITDPPYGIMKSLDKKYSWDSEIEPKEVFERATRLLRMNGRLILFSQEPYTSSLISEQEVHLPFNYRMIWLKNTAGNILMCKKAPVSVFEDILVFQNKCPHQETSICNDWVIKAVDRCGKEVFAEEMFNEGRYKNLASAKKNLSKKIKYGGDDYNNFFDEKMLTHLKESGVIEFSVKEYLKERDLYKKRYVVTFNLCGKEKLKNNVLEYKKDNQGLHPTQKPVKLMEDLVKTYTNEGDTVLDFTMGSGTTGVACKNLNRNFIGIELDEKYFNIAKDRIEGYLL